MDSPASRPYHTMSQMRKSGYHQGIIAGLRPERSSSGTSTQIRVKVPFVFSIIPVIQDSAHTRRAVWRIIVFSVLGIIQNLVYILRIRSFQEYDLRPPLLEEGRNLDELVHMLGIGRRVNIATLSLLSKSTFE